MNPGASPGCHQPAKWPATTAMIAPPTPTAVVAQKPTGPLPGISVRADNPTIHPMATSTIIRSIGISWIDTKVPRGVKPAWNDRSAQHSGRLDDLRAGLEYADLAELCFCYFAVASWRPCKYRSTFT